MSDIQGSESIRIDGDDLLLYLSDGKTVRVDVQGTNSDDETDMGKHFDGGGWPCWRVNGQDYVSVMFLEVSDD
jgi:hypothetical protein